MKKIPGLNANKPKTENHPVLNGYPNQGWINAAKEEGLANLS